MLKNRQHAARTFLPKWKGFVVNAESKTMSVTEAIEKTHAISVCLGSVYISTYDNCHKEIIVWGLQFNKVRIIKANFKWPC